MKKVLFTILAAAISLTACKKAQNTLPVAGNQSEQASEADGDDSRAIIAGHFKKNDNGLEMDYNLVIKEESKNKYVAVVKFNGLTLNGKDVKGSKDDKLQSVVLTFNNLKVDPKTGAVVKVDEKNSSETEKWKSLSVTGEVNQKSDDDNIIICPLDNDFDIERDLIFDVVSVSLAVTIENPVHVSSVGHQDNTLAYRNITISKLSKTTYQFYVNNYAKPGASVTINDVNTTTAVGISITEKGIITFTDEQEYFVLGSGHTVTQDPELAKAKVEGKDGYVNLVFTGDPAQEVTTVTYQPDAVSANNPKDPKEMIEFPVMKFKLTHYNQKNGVQRFISTQKWSDLYKTAPGKTGGVVRTNLARSYSRAGI